MALKLGIYSICGHWARFHSQHSLLEISRSVSSAGAVPKLLSRRSPDLTRASGPWRRFAVVRSQAKVMGSIVLEDSVGSREFSGLASHQEEVNQMDPVQQRLMFEDECILVDEKDNVVGHDSKYNCHLMENIESQNLLHRAFSVFLFNSKNELLLQKRSATKVTFPLVWTNTCCSHPLYRDSELITEDHLGVRNAAQRKLLDELGIEAADAPVDDFTCLGRILYKAPSDGKWGEHELDYLVFMKREVAVKPNPDEVADVRYVSKKQLQELVLKAKSGEDGVKLSPWFQLVVENFLYDWWQRIEDGTLSEDLDKSPAIKDVFLNYRKLKTNGKHPQWMHCFLKLQVPFQPMSEQQSSSLT